MHGRGDLKPRHAQRGAVQRAGRKVETAEGETYYCGDRDRLSVTIRLILVEFGGGGETRFSTRRKDEEVLRRPGTVYLFFVLKPGLVLTGGIPRET